MNRKSAFAFLVLLVCVMACSGDPKPDPKPAPQDSVSPDIAPTAQQIREKYLSLMNAGKAHYENRSTADAIRSFEQAVALLPGELPARLNLARACLLSQANATALSNAQRALRVDSRSVAALYLCGLASLRLDKGAEAVSYLERAIQLDPATSTIRLQLANALRLNNENGRANEELRAVLQLDPDNWSAHFQLAAAARRAGDVELSQSHLQDYQRLVKALSDAEKDKNSLEQCKYTVPTVPAGVHQPPVEAIKVRFAVGEIPTRPDTKKMVSPIVMLGIDSDGGQSFLARDASGDIKLVHSNGRELDVTKERLLAGKSSEHWRGRAADYDNDGLIDVFLFSDNSLHLFNQNADCSFSDSSVASGITKPGNDNQGARDALWLDYDSDGDVDLLVVNSNGRLVLWLNRGNGTFVNETSAAKISNQLEKVLRIAAADTNDDEAIDVVVALAEGPVRQLTNDGLGIFSLQEKATWPNGTICAVEDLDNDLRRDVVIASANRLHVVLADGQSTTLALGEMVASDVLLTDYDNDGWLDLLVVGRANGESAGAGRLILFRNAGAAPWQDVTNDVGLSGIDVDPLSTVQAADMDNDGDTDLFATAPDGSGVLLFNEGGQHNSQLKLRLRGTRSNRSGLGTLVEIRSGSFRLSRTVSRFPVEIGIGSLKELDSVKTIWPNGIVKNDIWVDPNEILNVEEPFISAGSCPYLYAWNGTSFKFVTDVLGSSPLGLSLRRGMFVPADTNEYVWVGDDKAMQHHGTGYAIQIADELREILYLDRVELVVVDHAPGTEAHPSTKLQPPPFAVGDVWVVEKRQNVLRAIDNVGNQWTEQLQQIDNRRTEPPKLRHPQLRGLAEPHSLDLDFGPIDIDQPLVLALTGWLQWGDASVNIAAGQNPDLPNPWPKLEAWTGNSWREVNVTVGLPAGKTKTILVDLDSVLPQGTQRLRLSSAYEVYWDRISMFVRSRQDGSKRHFLPVVEASLSSRGFPKQIRQDAKGPVVPDTANISQTPPWRTLPMGWCTRYGDITELINEKDDRLAIYNGGDGSIIKFTGSLPELPTGWHRDFFVQLDGWDKDSDYNVRCGDRVEPLPYHDMDEQRYGELKEPIKSDWMKRYNTRWVGRRLQ